MKMEGRNDGDMRVTDRTAGGFLLREMETRATTSCKHTIPTRGSKLMFYRLRKLVLDGNRGISESTLVVQILRAKR